MAHKTLDTRCFNKREAVPSDFCSTLRFEQWHRIIGALCANKAPQPRHAHCFPLLSAARATSLRNLQNIQPATEQFKALLKFAVFKQMSMSPPVGNESRSCYPRMRNRAIGKWELNPGEVARGIFRPHKNLFFSSWHISWNYNLTVHIPFAAFLPLSYISFTFS